MEHPPHIFEFFSSIPVPLQALVFCTLLVLGLAHFFNMYVIYRISHSNIILAAGEASS